MAIASAGVDQIDALKIVISEAILIGTPDCIPLKSWLSDKVIRAPD